MQANVLTYAAAAALLAAPPPRKRLRSFTLERDIRLVRLSAHLIGLQVHNTYAVRISPLDHYLYQWRGPLTEDLLHAFTTYTPVVLTRRLKVPPVPDLRQAGVACPPLAEQPFATAEEYEYTTQHGVVFESPIVLNLHGQICDPAF
jgi:hypothetical protein